MQTEGKWRIVENATILWMEDLNESHEERQRCFEEVVANAPNVEFYAVDVNEQTGEYTILLPNDEFDDFVKYYEKLGLKIVAHKPVNNMCSGYCEYFGDLNSIAVLIHSHFGLVLLEHE